MNHLYVNEILYFDTVHQIQLTASDFKLCYVAKKLGYYRVFSRKQPE